MEIFNQFHIHLIQRRVPNNRIRISKILPMIEKAKSHRTSYEKFLKKKTALIINKDIKIARVPCVYKISGNL